MRFELKMDGQLLGYTALESGDAAMGIACGRLVPAREANVPQPVDQPVQIIDTYSGTDLGVCRIEYNEAHPQGYVYLDEISYEFYVSLFPERREDGL